MNFLDLCRKVSQEGGITSGLSLPATVGGQTGNLKKIVGWTGDAWTNIQRSSTSWLWMRREFEKLMLADLGVYGADSLGATRHSAWISNAPITVSDPTDTAGRESMVVFRDWTSFRAMRLIGKARAVRGRPTEWTVNPQNEFVMWPVPDVVYTIRGEYQRAPQTLILDTDIPEAPPQHHDLIWREALIMLAVGTESFAQVRDWTAAASRDRGHLVSLQLPKMSFLGAPIG